MYSTLFQIIYNNLKLITTTKLSKYSDSVQYAKETQLSINNPNYQIAGIDSEKQPSWISLLKKDYDYRGSYYKVFHDVYLMGKSATAIYKGKIILDSILNSKGYLYLKSDKRHLLFYPFFKTNKAVPVAISLCNPLNGTFYHWLTEAVPMLEALKKHQTEHPKEKIHIIVNYPTPNFIIEYLNLLGFKQDIILSNKYNKIKVKKYIQSTIRFHQVEFSNQDKWHINLYPQSTFDFLREISTPIVENLPKKVYISREDASRKVLNEEELINIIKEKGYEKIVLSKKSVAYQIALFRNMTHLITPHGAALSNTIFSNNLKIIELFPKTRSLDYAYYFYQTSYYYNHKHWLYIIECDENQNLLVPIQSLKLFLEDEQ